MQTRCEAIACLLLKTGGKYKGPLQQPVHAAAAEVQMITSNLCTGNREEGQRSPSVARLQQRAGGGNHASALGPAAGGGIVVCC